MNAYKLTLITWTELESGAVQLVLQYTGGFTELVQRPTLMDAFEFIYSATGCGLEPVTVRRAA